MGGSAGKEHGEQIKSIIGKFVIQVHDGMDNQILSCFMCVGRKTRHFGKWTSYNKLCTYLNFIQGFIVEGKDRPKELVQ